MKLIINVPGSIGKSRSDLYPNLACNNFKPGLRLNYGPTYCQRNPLTKKKVWSFGSTNEEMVQLWKVYCQSVLEQSCIVWDSGLTNENQMNLERTQKTFFKMVLEEKYSTYYEALFTLRLQTLEERRKTLTLRFVKRSLSDGKLLDLFQKRNKQHNMVTRSNPKYIVFHANTTRYINSPILVMQRALNEAD